MGTASLSFEAWSTSWRDLLHKLAPGCDNPDCVPSQSLWQRVAARSAATRLQGESYCRPECLERALFERLKCNQPRTHRAPAHRVPLGLLLVSRQELTPAQLQAALAAQRTAGRGRIGEWLQTLGFATESQITAALARQWSCPVLRRSPQSFDGKLAPQLPFHLLEVFRIIPVGFAQRSGVLLVAFSEAIDYVLLYEIEQMLDCHTEPCLVCPTVLREALERAAQNCSAAEIVFDQLSDAAECARIIRSYSTRIHAEEVRLAFCGDYVWARLLRCRHQSLNLCLRMRASDNNQHAYPSSSPLRSQS